MFANLVKQDPGRLGKTVKQLQEQISPNHIQTLQCSSVDKSRERGIPTIFFTGSTQNNLLLCDKIGFFHRKVCDRPTRHMCENPPPRPYSPSCSCLLLSAYHNQCDHLPLVNPTLIPKYAATMRRGDGRIKPGLDCSSSFEKLSYSLDCKFKD